MDILYGYLVQFWGILAFLTFIFTLYLYNRKKAIVIARELILKAEIYSETFALNNGKEKFAWVSENGYKLLPPIAKVFISQGAFDFLIQLTFDRLIDWAEENSK